MGEIDKHPGKVWLHRCNSLEKLQEKHAEYPNFEVDLVYRNDGVFDVTHDSLESINLNFAAYLENVQNDTSHIWLDVKNLTKANARAMKLSLDSLLLRYNISKKTSDNREPKLARTGHIHTRWIFHLVLC